jgi:FixJ family two-component response regulator
MPGIEGEKAVRALAENDTTKDIPVILFSTRNDIENTCTRMNARDFIRKPFDIKTLRETVRKHLH